MLHRDIDCILTTPDGTRPIHVVRPSGLAGFFDTLPAMQAAYLRDAGFTAKAGQVLFLPGTDGIAAAVLGAGADASPYVFGGLPAELPSASSWRLEPGAYDPHTAILGYLMGAYRYDRFRPTNREMARIFVPDTHQDAVEQAEATWMVRDLINTPANVLGPEELAAFTLSLAERYGGRGEIISGAALEHAYPMIAAVGRGSARPPQVARFHWRGTGAGDDAPLVSLCGKGVCFDTGGYDLKPSAAMLRMKKDMGGAATMLGLARLIMQADLPVRLMVRIGCVENSVSGTAMRPSDVVRTRSGMTVEIGNTDAEGRLVLCDLLDEASEEAPALLIDAATLTGAARVALGPELPALFCNDDVVAESLVRHGLVVHDPMWRLPLWPGYEDWLKSSVADLNNVSAKPMAGAIVAALYLQRFVKAGIPWVHLDIYAWNDQSRPGRPEGGEAMTMRALQHLIAAGLPVNGMQKASADGSQVMEANDPETT